MDQKGTEVDRRNNRRDEDGLSVVTANRLLDGRIVWLDPQGAWQLSIRNAATFPNDSMPERLATQTARAAADEVVGVYGVQVVLSSSGPEPLTTRERIRAFGPSVHEAFTPAWQPPAQSGRA
ncbi:hypothetical protein APE01nite_03570 [Acetobacter peroxydans]|jgi:hypothetical protein|uniref:DUF2849 domain-containing protein n=1 Tax=Acetobacter peroxydans TaxID=104098 RepID=A0A4Y3TUB4_9PROT|nr:hypothetical protein AA13755_1577 [Acetobacter peroxydans NBRC 13755]GBR41977.1 hypothetical protein AA0475_1325 [Acetobacter peroxydans]GEB84560.1 hypothetical protein APE01nite_03570 [Acetobacter peroxydans]